MKHKVLLAACVAAALVTCATLKASAEVQWVGIAASSNGRAFAVTAFGEGDAREAAQNKCETSTARSCNSIAIPKNSGWRAIALYCDSDTDSEGFVGASRNGGEKEVALDKAYAGGFQGAQECRAIGRY